MAAPRARPAAASMRLMMAEMSTGPSLPRMASATMCNRRHRPQTRRSPSGSSPCAGPAHGRGAAQEVAAALIGAISALHRVADQLQALQLLCGRDGVHVHPRRRRRSAHRPEPVQFLDQSVLALDRFVPALAGSRIDGQRLLQVLEHAHVVHHHARRCPARGGWRARWSASAWFFIGFVQVHRAAGGTSKPVIHIAHTNTSRSGSFGFLNFVSRSSSRMRFAVRQDVQAFWPSARQSRSPLAHHHRAVQRLHPRQAFRHRGACLGGVAATRCACSASSAAH